MIDTKMNTLFVNNNLLDNIDKDIFINIIDIAFDYYNLNRNYKSLYYGCLECVFSERYNLEMFVLIYKSLYAKPSIDLKKLWKDNNVNKFLVNFANTYITNLILLLGYPNHKNNIEKYNCDRYQINIQKYRIRQILEMNLNNKNVSISQMVWGSYIMCFKVIEIGRLQYEFINYNSIRIHIPGGNKLDISKVKESLVLSKKYINKYYNIYNYNYYCDSWLLSRQVHNLADINSNIYKFYNLFDVKDGYDCISDVLFNVYSLDKRINYKNLPSNTSLQKTIKEFLINGGIIKLGSGVLKNIF